MAKVISFMNNKGGVGKTTSAYAVGLAWAKVGKRILFIDLDSQANLTSLLSNTDPMSVNWELTIEDVFIDGDAGDLKSSIRHTDNPNIDFVPSDLDLSSFEVDTNRLQAVEFLLYDLLEPVKSEYDFVIVDCPPAIQKLTYNAMVASDYIVLVSSLDGKSYKGLQMMSELYNKVIHSKRLNPSLVLIGIIATMYQHDKVNEIFWRMLKENFGPYVIEPHVRKSTVVNRANSFNTNFLETEPNSKVAQDYLLVAEELLVRVLDDMNRNAPAKKK